MYYISIALIIIFTLLIANYLFKYTKNSTFEGLPSDIREKFDYSVQNLLDFIADEANATEAQDLGLLPKTEAPESANLENVAEDSNSATSSEESVTES